jgi:hypothetical protein
MNPNPMLKVTAEILLMMEDLDVRWPHPGFLLEISATTGC